jgi:DNA-binding response OmpR family regulator
MDGLQTALTIRARRPSDEQPYIIAITSSSKIYNTKLCIGAGMDDYLHKPFSINELQMAIDKFKVGPQQHCCHLYT